MANFVETGFQRIMRDVVAEQSTTLGLLADFQAGNNGGNMREIERRFDNRLSSIAWSWPWFDDWHARFSKIQRWPYMWTHYWQSRIAAQPEYLERQKRALLADTIGRAVTQARDLESGRKALRMLGAEGYCWDLHTGDGEFHDLFLPGIASEIARGNLSQSAALFPRRSISSDAYPCYVIGAVRNKNMLSDPVQRYSCASFGGWRTRDHTFLILNTLSPQSML